MPGVENLARKWKKQHLNHLQKLHLKVGELCFKYWKSLNLNLKLPLEGICLSLLKLVENRVEIKWSFKEGCIKTDTRMFLTFQDKTLMRVCGFYFFTQLIAWGSSLLLEGLQLAWEPSAIMGWACPVRLEPSKGLRKYHCLLLYQSKFLLSLSVL